MTQIALQHPQAIFHPEAVCPRGWHAVSAVHARTLGDCLVDLADAITAPHVLPETEIENFGACLADARADGMDVQYRLIWQPDSNRWALTLRVLAAGNRFDAARATMTLTYAQFDVIDSVLRAAGVAEVRNA